MDKSPIGKKLTLLWVRGVRLIRWTRGWMPQKVSETQNVFLNIGKVKNSVRGRWYYLVPTFVYFYSYHTTSENVPNNHLVELFRNHLIKCWKWTICENNWSNAHPPCSTKFLISPEGGNYKGVTDCRQATE